MRVFSNLYESLDGTNSTNEKVHLMTHYFKEQDPETVAWTLFFLAGQRSKKNVSSAKLRKWAQELTQIPEWLMDDCYGAVGDTAEMVALVLDANPHIRNPATETESPFAKLSLGEVMREHILPLITMPEEEQKTRVIELWRQFGKTDIFIINKFLTGGLRVGVSETLVYRALSEASGLARTTIASRLIGRWHPSAEFAEQLFRPEGEVNEGQLATLPKPFCLAAPIEVEVSELGDTKDWQIEWKWDGIRCQAVKRGNNLDLWSRGEERITASFPDMVKFLGRIPGDWTLDGELVAEDWQKPALFSVLQKRLNRKNPSKATMAEVPVAFIAYDLLDLNQQELSLAPLVDRRRQLEELLTPWIDKNLGPSELIHPKSWDEAAQIRQTSRDRGAEGLMIKKLDSIYETGRKRGVWFKWKVEPFTIDAILTAAQPGTGRRASLYTDYTFSIWKGDQRVPIAKAYSGLTDVEIRSLDAWIRHHTLERHGPVRMLEPLRVFEIAFEGLAESPRHKSGFALRFPRILRERVDKPADQADRVENIAALLQSMQKPGGVATEAQDPQMDLPL